MHFIFTDNNTVATEDTSAAERIEGVSEGAAVDGASDTDCDNGDRAPQTETLVNYTAATAAVNNVAYVP